ncbi:MAG: prolyl oligopeptidase family serine peptidase [Butyrivibrio sp.]|uniref:carboxylesterase family protein n=1 Tax=Butyrivibrio sp. TaxID=28121 RepID=UPI0025E05BB9|nr:alpha/beta hydrolase-fold protein [Butyrivibrio sp.]MCR5772890.1 prolyl oligopeptidase family serine peptidase [Butyrivibrio sp.]
MFRKFATSLLTAAMVISLVACGSTQSQSETTSETEISTETAQTDNTQEVESTEEASVESSDTEAADTETTETSVSLGAVANDLAEDEEALVDTYADLFEQLTYTDEETGLSITYNLYLPEGYDESQEYPMVVFIGDSSCAGTDATYSLTQGRGGLVWATEEWQSAYPSIVVVPTYPETILDDHGSYTTTEYVELTKRFIDYMTEEYSVDSDRIYGTGQSMGCMTTLILASEYPDLYAACMFVDGQWDISLLEGLEGQTFVYFAAEDDTNAWNGMQEVMSMFDEDSIEYTYAQWDGTWSVDELSEAATELFSGESTNAYFISWASGTIDASTGNSAAGSGDMGSMSGGFGGPSSSEDSSSEDSSQEFTLPEDGSAPEGMSGDFAGPSDSESGEMSGDMSSSGTDSSAYHMASFDYAYNCVAVMEWLFQQTNE